MQEAGHAASESAIRDFSFYPIVDTNLFDLILKVFLIGHCLCDRLVAPSCRRAMFMVIPEVVMGGLRTDQFIQVTR
jgi:hypothetical protein